MSLAALDECKKCKQMVPFHSIKDGYCLNCKCPDCGRDLIPDLIVRNPKGCCYRVIMR